MRRFLLLLLLLPAALPGGASEPGWRKQVIDLGFRAEDIAAADINRDGRLDLMAGELWYEAPHWQPHEIRRPGAHPPRDGYSECFITDAADINGDGWPDQIVVGFPGKAALWRENPGRAGGYWPEHQITTSACNESPAWTDVTGDGRPELLAGFEERRMAFHQPLAGGEWRMTAVGGPDLPGVRRFSHGLGAGDMNGDGRIDIITTGGWYQAPAKGTAEWSFIPADLGPDCAQMYAYDFDGDGDQDLISSSAHRAGVWWRERLPGDGAPQFRRHLIDETVSQTHALVQADINNDGQPDWVTGKRWWAHGPTGDVNPNDPPLLLWYEYRRRNGAVEWIRHQIDDASGAGTGFKVVDMNDDGRLDIAVANKRGVFLFQQTAGSTQRGG